MGTAYQPPGTADEVSQARLPRLDPVLVHPVAVTDQDAGPVVDEGGKGFFGATRMDHIEGHPLTGHHPEPREGVETVPGGFINIVDGGRPRYLSRDRRRWGD